MDERREGQGVFAVLGLFPDAGALLDAIPRVRAEMGGRARLEAYSPHPVHGIERALGLRPSPLGGMVMIMGVVGALTALAFQAWISAVDYPIVTGGKAPGSWEAFIPIVFEVMVLFAAFTAGLGMILLLNRLPFYGHPVLGSRAMGAVTRDRFALSLEADPLLDAGAAREALVRAGATDLEEVPVPAPGPTLTSRFLLGLLGASAASALAAGTVTWITVKAVPTLPPFSHMLDQPRVDPQRPSTFFGDGRSMRMPVPGTVARGHLPLDPDRARLAGNPLPRTEAVLARGRKVFMERCALCHGPLGAGHGTLTGAYGAAPANLQGEDAMKDTDGEIFVVVSRGKNAMPGHEAALSPEDRWSVVHYVRALQRAQHARDEDLGGAP